VDLRLKRAYEPAEAADGERILIDRLWPRGVRRADAHLDEWARELAPSTELRRWFGHDPAASRSSGAGTPRSSSRSRRSCGSFAGGQAGER